MKNKATEKLFYLAYTDAMTETLNRNSYEERLQKLRRNGTALGNITAAVVDINGLKRINDTYGHHTGDEVIRFVADMLKKTIDGRADIYRVGGDEFVCISEKNICPLMKQFIELVDFENKDRCYKVSVAVGYAVFDREKHRNIDDLIKWCDKKMYKDKKRQSR